MHATSTRASVRTHRVEHDDHEDLIRRAGEHLPASVAVPIDSLPLSEIPRGTVCTCVLVDAFGIHMIVSVSVS